MTEPKETAIQQAVRLVGGEQRAATICGKSVQAVRKWLEKGCLPRTEYTGETNHAERLAAGSNGQFTADWLLESAKPGRATNEAA